MNPPKGSSCVGCFLSFFGVGVPSAADLRRSVRGAETAVSLTLEVNPPLPVTSQSTAEELEAAARFATPTPTFIRPVGSVYVRKPVWFGPEDSLWSSTSPQQEPDFHNKVTVVSVSFGLKNYILNTILHKVYVFI